MRREDKDSIPRPTTDDGSGSRGIPNAESTPSAASDLHELDALYRFLAEHSRDIIWRSSADGVILYASPAMRTTLGYEPKEIVGRSFFDLLHPDDLEKAHRDHAAILSSPAAHVTTLRLRRRDGSFVWLEFHGRSVRDESTGDVSEILSTSRDVTERRLAELAMSESERRFRATFEQAAVGVGHVALDGRWLRVNQRLSDLTGYSGEDLLARGLRSVTHPDDVTADEEGAARLLAGEVEVHRREERYVRKDGAVVWVNLTMSLVLRDDGAPDYFLAVVEDISRRKRSEDDLALARRELSQMEKLSALGTLIGGVAHELRTPLTYAYNHLHLMQRRVQSARENPLTDDDLKQMESGVAEALEGLERINRLVQDLRQFASRDRGQHVSAQLNDAVAEALDLFRATHRGTHWVEARLGSVPSVAVDRVQMQQIVLNLLENAADAMERGGRIDVATRTSGDDAEIVVEDRGGGIPQEAQARLFDPFYTTKTHGMGLGLSIVRRLVEAHHGRIEFETRPGEGTTFRVRIPLPDA